MRLRYALPLLSVLAAPMASAQATLPFFEGFAYAVGDSLPRKGTWKTHSGTSLTDGPVVVAGDLSFPGYVTPTTGTSVQLTGGAGSRKDVNTEFTPITSGSAYAFAVVNVSAAAATSDYLLHFAAAGLAGASFRGRLGVVASSVSPGYSFTLTKGTPGTGNANVAVESTVRPFNTPVAVVIKYTINPAGTTDDDVRLYVFSAALPPAEPPAPTLQVTNALDLASSDITPGAIALRQGSQAYAATVDNVLVSTAWQTAVARDDDARPGSRALAVWGRRVRLTLDAPTTVRLSLFDVLGREVATLHDGYGAGVVEAALPDGLSAGVYVVRAVGDGVRAATTVVVR